MKKDKFGYKCICMWSKDDEYGFIPNLKCPVHGKKAREMLRRTKEFKMEKKK